VAEAMHSNKSQGARTRALESFRKGITRVLVASDIVARGLDVDGITHVINYDLPGDGETYVHRIGRTGRAGAAGQAITFCSSDQRGDLRDIERSLGKSIAVLKCTVKPLPSTEAAHAAAEPQPQTQAPRRHTPSQTKGRAPSAARPAGKTGSPEQQKNDFWRSRRRPRRGGGASSGSGASRR
jgi:ATP-dependent RNA helicase RhlE